MKRIGLIVPSSNTVMEPDFYLHLPENAALHTARMHLKDVTAEDEAKMLDDHTLPAARDLATLHPDVVVFGCTSAGALRGNEYEENLIKEIEKTSGAPTVSVNKSVRNSLKKLQARRLVILTPYLDELNLRIRNSFENDGFEVLHIDGLQIRENTEIARVDRETIINFAIKSVSSYSPDALFISCTNFPVVNVLTVIQEQLNFPVLSSNQVVLDSALAVLGLKKKEMPK